MTDDRHHVRCDVGHYLITFFCRPRCAAFASILQTITLPTTDYKPFIFKVAPILFLIRIRGTMPVNPFNRPHPFVALVSHALLLVMLIAGVSTSSAQAQDDQEYKRVYNAGLQAYEANQLSEARTQWARSAQLAQQAGDSEIARKSAYYVAQVDYKLGIQAYKAGNFDQAVQHHQAGTAMYPDYTKNLYGEGLALKKLGRIDEALAVAAFNIAVKSWFI